MKITKREILFFFIGMAALFLIESIYNWKEMKASFMEGWNAGYCEKK